MFNNLINLFAKPLDEVKLAIDEKEILALAAIFIRIAKLDGSFDISERQKIKELVESEEVPKNVFLTSNLLHEKTVAFYFDALNRNY